MVEPVAERPIAPAVYRFPDDPAARLQWSRTEQRLRDAQSYWVVTASARAVPHATPIWGVFVDGDLYANGLPTARWARNLAANPRVTVHLESAEDVVIVEGDAADVTTDADLGERIVAEWLRKYGRLEPEPVNDGVFRVRPRTARAWSHSSLHDGTRWRL
jgi:hypothetical protein